MSYADIQSADVVESISYADFVEGYVKPSVPVIVKGAFSHLEAASWTPEVLAEKWGDKLIPYAGVMTPLRDILDRIVNSKADDPAPYLNSIDVQTEFPEISADLGPGLELAWPNYRFMRRLFPGWYFPRGGHFTEFFIGGDGRGFPELHIDTPPMNTYISLFYGAKEWIMFHPDERPNMYMDDPEFRNVDKENIYSPNFDKYPNLAKCKPYIVPQQAGELLLVPPRWIHTTRNLAPSISIAWDQLEPASFPGFIEDKVQGIGEKRPAVAQIHGLYLHALSLMFRCADKVQTTIRPSRPLGRII